MGQMLRQVFYVEVDHLLQHRARDLSLNGAHVVSQVVVIGFDCQRAEQVPIRPRPPDSKAHGLHLIHSVERGAFERGGKLLRRNNDPGSVFFGKDVLVVGVVSFHHTRHEVDPLALLQVEDHLVALFAHDHHLHLPLRGQHAGQLREIARGDQDRLCDRHPGQRRAPLGQPYSIGGRKDQPPVVETHEYRRHNRL